MIANKLGEQLVQVLPAELPFKGLGRRFPVVLKIEESLRQNVQVWEIAGRQNLPLDNGEVDLHLVEPTGMDRRVDQDQLWIRALQALHSPEAAVSRTVVDDPEDAASVIVGRARHDLLDEAVKRPNTILLFAAPTDPGMVDIQTGDLGPGPAPKILVLYLHRATRAAGAGRMFASPGLNAGFFVRGDHELIILQGLPFPRAGIQIENAAGFVGKVGIARKIQLR